jgi:hypothetical protein
MESERKPGVHLEQKLRFDGGVSGTVIEIAGIRYFQYRHYFGLETARRVAIVVVMLVMCVVATSKN